MIKRILAGLLIGACLLTSVSCGSQKSLATEESMTDGTPEKLDLHVDLAKARQEDLGALVPQIIFAHDGKLAFWSQFGLYVVNTDDGTFYRTLDIGKIGYNYMVSDIVSEFFASDDYRRIYFFNIGEDDNNTEDYYMYYNIEEDVVRQVPANVEVAVLEKPKLYSLEYAGGSPGGYSSPAVVYDDHTFMYLNAADWYVKDLTLCIYDTNTKETKRLELFQINS